MAVWKDMKVDRYNTEGEWLARRGYRKCFSLHRSWWSWSESPVNVVFAVQLFISSHGNAELWSISSLHVLPQVRGDLLHVPHPVRGGQLQVLKTPGALESCSNILQTAESMRHARWITLRTGADCWCWRRRSRRLDFLGKSVPKWSLINDMQVAFTCHL